MLDFEIRRAGLGSEFIHDVRETLASIGQMPSAGSPVADQYRKLRTPRFRYAVIYDEAPEAILIIHLLAPGRDSILLLHS
jgi:hypothetical protein